MTTLSDLIMKIISKASSMRPMANKDIWIALRKTRPETTPDELPDVLEQLTNNRVLATCRITRGDITQETYWPTGLRNPVLIGAPPMSNPNTSASKLLRAIVLHGPITGADLAIKSGIPAKSIDSLLESATTRDAVTSRRGFCAEKGRELKHYMTTTQAVDWDASATAAEKELIDAVKGEPDQDAAAHVMSAPEAPASAKQSEGEIPANETATENAELAEARRTIQSLHDSIDDMLGDWTDIRQALDVSTQEQAIAEIGNLQRLAENNQQRAQSTGRLALLLIDSADLTEVEELDANCDPRIAQAAAMARIDHGHAARAVVVRIIGEAVRQVEWKAAA